MSVFIENKIKRKVNISHIKPIVEKIELNTIKVLKLDSKLEINLLLINDKKIRKINNEFRNENIPTDVLSFPLETKIGDTLFLGDIVISITTAIKQAKKMDNTLLEEIGFLFCHGLLHLLGYDHIDEKTNKKMFDIQDQILKGVFS